MVQYIPNEVSTKPAAKEDDKGQTLFLDFLFTMFPDIHVHLIFHVAAGIFVLQATLMIA